MAASKHLKSKRAIKGAIAAGGSTGADQAKQTTVKISAVMLTHADLVARMPCTLLLGWMIPYCKYDAVTHRPVAVEASTTT